MFGVLRWQGRDGIEHHEQGKPAELLALLAVLHTESRAVTRSWLADALFSDTDEASARKLLSNIVYRLRRALGIESIHLLTTDQSLSLTDITTDAGLVQAACMATDAQPLLAVLPAVREPLLAEFDQAWAQALRTRLQASLHALLASHMQQAWRVRDDAKTLFWAQHVLSVVPTDEAACGMAMRLLAKSGQTAQAVALFEDTSRALQHELDMQPGAELLQLATALRHDQALAAIASPHVFVGRKRERARTLRWLEGSDSRLLLVEGDAGIGKSALLEEIAKAARWRAWQVGHGKANETGAPPLLAPLDGALRGILHAANRATLGATLGHSTAALLLNVLEGRAHPAAADAGTRPLLMDVVIAQALDTLIADTPTLLLLDDVHWAALTLWELLPALALACARLPLRIILVARSVELRANQAAWRALQLQESNGALEPLLMTGLTVDELGSLAQLCGREGVDAHQLAQLSGGNPLVATAWLRGNEQALQAVAQVFAPRLRALDAVARNALARAALVGEQVTLALWQRINDDIAPPVDALLAAGLIQPTVTGYALGHDLLRASLAGVLEPSDLRQTHARIARAIADRADASQLAFHHECAGEHALAVMRHCEAADMALRIGARPAAQAALTQAIRCAGDDAASLLRVRLLQLCMEQPGSWTHAHEAGALEVLRDAEAAHDRDTVLRIGLMHLRQLGRQSRFEDLASVGERVQRVARAMGDERAAILLAAEVGRIRVQVQLQQDLDQPALENLLRRAETLGEPDSLASVLMVLSVLYHRQGELTRAHDCLLRVEALRAANPEILIDTQQYLSLKGILLAALFADREQAYAVHMQRLNHARQIGDAQTFCAAAHSIAIQAIIMGQVEQAVLVYEQMLAVSIKSATSGDDAMVHMARGLLCNSLLEAGHIDRAEHAFAPVAAWLAAGRRDGLPGFSAWVSCSMLRQQQGQFDAALRANEQVLAFELLKGTMLSVPLLMRAHILAQNGSPREAAAFLERARPLVDLARPSDELNYLHWVDYCVHRNPLSLARARQAYFEIALRLTSPANRCSALTRRAVMIELAAEWARLVLPGRETVIVQDAQDADVHVTWTLDDGLLDAEIAGRGDTAQLRQHRLKRLTLEANMQGVFASHAQLARALNVTTRTIERDCAALAAQGIVLHTRIHAGELSVKRS